MVKQFKSSVKIQNCDGQEIKWRGKFWETLPKEDYKLMVFKI